MNCSDNPKDWEMIKVTADGQEVKGPCLLKSIQVRSGSGGVGVATLYDGSSASGKDVVCITAATSRCSRNDYDMPVYFPKGIYVDLGTNAEFVRIQILKLKKG